MGSMTLFIFDGIAPAKIKHFADRRGSLSAFPYDKYNIEDAHRRPFRFKETLERASFRRFQLHRLEVEPLANPGVMQSASDLI